MRVNNEEINKKFNEHYMQEEEEKYISSVKIYDTVKLQAYDIIHQLLEGGTIEDKKSLLRFCLDPRNIQLMNCIPELSYFLVVIDIVIVEINKKAKATFITGRKSIDEILIILTQIKFYLWEIEFGINEQGERELLSFMENYQISFYALGHCIQKYSVDKQRVVRMFLDVYEHCGDKTIRTAFEKYMRELSVL